MVFALALQWITHTLLCLVRCPEFSEYSSEFFLPQAETLPPHMHIHTHGHPHPATVWSPLDFHSFKLKQLQSNSFISTQIFLQDINDTNFYISFIFAKFGSQDTALPYCLTNITSSMRSFLFLFLNSMSYSGTAEKKPCLASDILTAET